RDTSLRALSTALSSSEVSRGLLRKNVRFAAFAASLLVRLAVDHIRLSPPVSSSRSSGIGGEMRARSAPLQDLISFEVVSANAYGRALGRVLYPAWERLRGRPTFELLDLLERKQRASADELAAIQSGALRRLIRHAYMHTAYYRRILDDAGLHPDDIRE